MQAGQCGRPPIVSPPVWFSVPGGAFDDSCGGRLPADSRGLTERAPCRGHAPWIAPGTPEPKHRPNFARLLQSTPGATIL